MEPVGMVMCLIATVELTVLAYKTGQKINEKIWGLIWRRELRINSERAARIFGVYDDRD